MSPTSDQPAGGRRRRALRRGGIVVAAATAAALVVPAVTGQEESAAAAELVPFDDCAELGRWYRDIALDQVGPWGLTGGTPTERGWWAEMFGGSDEIVAGSGGSGTAESGQSMSAADSGRSGDAVGSGATGTNVQEAGVDEPDLVKTDGRRVLALSGSTLHVLTTDSEELQRVGSLTLDDQRVQELLLLGDRALVVGHRELPLPEPRPLPTPPEGLPEPDEDGSGPGLDSPDPGPIPVPEPMPAPEPLPEPLPEPSMDLSMPRPESTVLTVVDLSDERRPQVVRSEEVEARYLSARAANGAVRVVLGSTPSIPFPQPEYDQDGQIDEDRAEELNREAVENLDDTAWLPSRVTRDASGAEVGRAPVVECADVSRPVDPAGLGTVTVLTLDAGTDDLATVDSDAVSANSSVVYASPERLYVATTRGAWGIPMPIDPAMSAVVGPSAPGGTGSTQLHGFDISDADDTEYVASGSVPGWLLSRWALSAQDGMLRVATTVDGGPSQDGAPGTEAVVTVLEESGGELTEVGSVGDLGKGEQIHAVRWFGDLAVVVTFRQTDPLYTVDLSDPTEPTVMGELKIPGYSAYLHPVGEGRLLGVGQDATETGQTTGAQVSSFDLRDLSDPTRTDTLTYPNAWTDVEHESRAFTYLPEQRVALVPMSAGNGAGVVAVSVSEDGELTEAGRWTARTSQWEMVLRAIPVEGDAVVAVSEGEQGRRVTLLGTPTLEVLDAADLG